MNGRTQALAGDEARARTRGSRTRGRRCRSRLCSDLFGPEDDKREFKVLDFCQNLEYFSQQLVPADGAGGAPLSEQIFRARLELIQTFDAIHAHDDERAEVAGVLREVIASMNENNFLVRPPRITRSAPPATAGRHSDGTRNARADTVAGALSIGDCASRRYVRPMEDDERRQWVVHVDRRHCRVVLTGCPTSGFAPAKFDQNRSDASIRVWVDGDGNVIAAEAFADSASGTLDERADLTSELVERLRERVGMGPGQFGVPTLWGPVPGFEDGYTYMFSGELDPPDQPMEQRAGLEAAADRAKRNRERTR